MDYHLEAEKRPRDQLRKNLGEILTVDEPEASSADTVHVDALKSEKVHKKKHNEKRAYDSEELVKHMSNLPSYLERGKFLKEKAFNVGVLDWKHLERWQKKHKQIPSRSNGYSASSTNTSSFLSAEGSSSKSTMLLSHLNVSSTEPSESVSSCKPPEMHQRVPKTIQPPDLQHTIRNRRPPDVKGVNAISGSKVNMTTSNGETIQEGDNATADLDCKERGRPVVLLVPKDGRENGHGLSSNNASDTTEKLKASNYAVSHDCYIPNKLNTIKNSEIDKKGVKNLSSRPNEPSKYPGKFLFSPPRGTNLDSKKLKNTTAVSPPIKENAEATKVRNPSPTRRFNIAFSAKGWSSNAKDVSTVPPVAKEVNPQSGQERVESALSLEPTSEKSNPNNRAKSSPLRRLLDPLLRPRKSTSEHFHGSSDVDSTSKDRRSKSAPRRVECPKVKLDLKGCKTIDIDDSCAVAKHRPSRMQALFQVAVKNGVPLFKFAVENEGDILAATMKQVNSPTRQKNHRVYSFCTVRELKKKSTNWGNQGGRDRGRGYISSVVAQMKVSDVPSSVNNQRIREFVLFATEVKESSRLIPDLQPAHELAAIVVKSSSSRNASQEDFGMNVVLPGGNHGLPGKGEPSPLIERWKSGGSCDCGGWDLGCKLRVLSNHSEAIRGPSSTNTQSTAERFDLFYQGEDNEDSSKPVFSMWAFKDRIFSVECSSSLTPLQAFSICIAILNVRKQDRVHEANSSCLENSSKRLIPSHVQAQTEFPSKYISIPPISPADRV